MTVSELGGWVNNGHSEDFTWKISRRRDLFVWEKELEQQLMELIVVVQWNKLKVDTWDWVGEDTTSYTVQFGYGAL